MSTGTRVLDRLRRPEYTGDNRCIPCTATNLVIAAVLSAGVWALLPTSLAPALGAAVFVVAAAAIYLRGYLVPGTPWLTRTYFPDWLLRAFDKGPTVESPAAGGEVDVESVLLDAGAVSECDDVDDLCIEPDFREAWRAEVEAIAEPDERPRDLASVLGEGVHLEEHGDPPAATDGTSLVGQWPSDAAFVADVAGGTVLADRYPAWTGLEPAERAAVLTGLRLFVERCPSCGGPVTMGEEAVPSCCRWHDVIAVACDDCGARLLETEVPDEA
ncbi:MAG TPA: hypothetical protein VKA37_03185 [Halobacteriales archaeon]|nr:hypothetical protein [Halobacteriales archaeon]